ncbi:MAG: DUF5677 domain-containing protein [Bacilli bacterium]|nr:DUF5677 domain-containing protein [Bacilli bacterium]
MEKQAERKSFNELLDLIQTPSFVDREFIFETFEEMVEGAKGLKEINASLSAFQINYIQLALYLVNEHIFYLHTHPNVKQEEAVKDEQYQQFLASVSLDKYYTNEHLAYRMGSLGSKYDPAISTINLYLNFILGMLSHYKNNDPKETLVVDIMNKGFQMAKCVSSLLENGFETEAFSTWRTLHENECILEVIVKYGQPVMERYLKHMRYSLAFRGGIPSKEETDAVFVEIKEGMRAVDLKSKDMKRYIEYGWLLGVPDVMKIQDFKFNFRDGVERVAGLSNYSKVYEMSSEIAHSSPLLIYSRKEYFYLITLLNLYESFFRIEKIFMTLHMSSVSPEDQKNYIRMRKMYYGELLANYEIQKNRLANLANKK